MKDEKKMTDDEKKRIRREQLNQTENRFGTSEDYHDALTDSRAVKRHIAAYKCRAGCVHIEFDALMLSLTETDFFELSDVILQLRNALIMQQQQREDEEFIYQGLM